VTLYRLYTENGNRAGFWVQHRTWANRCARVHSIAGQSEGALPLALAEGVESLVSMQVFDVRSGRRVDPATAQDNPVDRNYTRIAEPNWCHRTKEPQA
jgi:hypothetical protein